MSWVAWQEKDWRPNKMECAALRSLAREGGLRGKAIEAHLHREIWWKYRKISSKDLTWTEYNELVKLLEIDARMDETPEPRPEDSM